MAFSRFVVPPWERWLFVGETIQRPILGDVAKPRKYCADSCMAQKPRIGLMHASRESFPDEDIFIAE